MEVKDKNYLDEYIEWNTSDDAEHPYNVNHEGKKFVLRINDFPAEHFYTLLIDNNEVANFDDWPSNWVRMQDEGPASSVSNSDNRETVISIPTSVEPKTLSTYPGPFYNTSIPIEQLTTIFINIIDHYVNYYEKTGGGFSSIFKKLFLKFKQKENLPAVANPEHVKLLKRGVKAWNQWRVDNPVVQPELCGADLSGINLSGINLSRAFLIGANLSNSDLTNARLDNANLSATILVRSNLTGALLSNSILALTNLNYANLHGALLTDTKCFKATFLQANLIGASLSESNLFETDLSGADLRDCGFVYSRLINSNFRDTNLSNCRVYGVTAWNIDVSNAVQSDLLISNKDEHNILVDNIEFAQFLSLLLQSQGIQNILDSVSSRAVLVLGHFVPDRNSVLSVIRDELRRRNYTPIVININRPFTKDLHQTVTMLSRVAKFVVIDIPEATNIVTHLQSVIPNINVPIQPLVECAAPQPEAAQEELNHELMLSNSIYRNSDELSKLLKDHVIAQAEAKALEVARTR